MMKKISCASYKFSIGIYLSFFFGRPQEKSKISLKAKGEAKRTRYMRKNINALASIVYIVTSELTQGESQAMIMIVMIISTTTIIVIYQQSSCKKTGNSPQSPLHGSMRAVTLIEILFYNSCLWQTTSKKNEEKIVFFKASKPISFIFFYQNLLCFVLHVSRTRKLANPVFFILWKKGKQQQKPRSQVGNRKSQQENKHTTGFYFMMGCFNPFSTIHTAAALCWLLQITMWLLKLCYVREKNIYHEYYTYVNFLGGMCFVGTVTQSQSSLQRSQGNISSVSRQDVLKKMCFGILPTFFFFLQKKCYLIQMHM